MSGCLIFEGFDFWIYIVLPNDRWVFKDGKEDSTSRNKPETKHPLLHFYLIQDTKLSTASSMIWWFFPPICPGAKDFDVSSQYMICFLRKVSKILPSQLDEPVGPYVLGSEESGLSNFLSMAVLAVCYALGKWSNFRHELKMFSMVGSIIGMATLMSMLAMPSGPVSFLLGKSHVIFWSSTAVTEGGGYMSGCANSERLNGLNKMSKR